MIPRRLARSVELVAGTVLLAGETGDALSGQPTSNGPGGFTPSSVAQARGLVYQPPNPRIASLPWRTSPSPAQQPAHMTGEVPIDWPQELKRTRTVLRT